MNTLRSALPHAALATAALLIAAGPALAAEPPQPAASRIDIAREAYDIGHWQRAFDAYAALADEGHCEAARIAAEMQRYGRVLYGLDFQAAPARLRVWRTLQPCPIAQAAR